MNQLKEQIISLNVELEDKQKTFELLQKKLEQERNEFSSFEERITDKWQQTILVKNLFSFFIPIIFK